MKVSTLIALLPSLALAMPVNNTASQNRNFTLDPTPPTYPDPSLALAMPLNNTASQNRNFTLDPTPPTYPDPTINFDAFDVLNITHKPDFIFGEPEQIEAIRHKQYLSEIDQLLFTFSLADFTRTRATGKPVHLLWSSFGCVNWAPESEGAKLFDFTEACHRHVFAEKNYKREKVWGDQMQQKVYRRVLGDMEGICDAKYKHVNGMCYEYASLYFEALGGRHVKPPRVLGAA